MLSRPADLDGIDQHLRDGLINHHPIASTPPCSAESPKISQRMAAVDTARQTAGPRLRFCPESNDLLYPREDRERRVLVFYCKSCDYQEDADPSEWLVFRNEIKHSHKERTVILQDVRSDPTLPRTKDVVCPECQNQEAVFFSASTEEGMTLFFNCTSCGHRWRDYV